MTAPRVSVTGQLLTDPVQLPDDGTWYLVDLAPGGAGDLTWSTWTLFRLADDGEVAARAELRTGPPVDLDGTPGWPVRFTGS